MNNYLIAAILDGSFVMRKQDVVRESLRERVRDLGKSESLLEDGSSWHRGRSKREESTITVPASLLFELPKGYAKALDEYNDAMKKWTAEMKTLESSIEAMKIKVQIGSDKSLEALVEQADSLCSMSLTAANKLLLGNGK